jgi:hypothetical protein
MSRAALMPQRARTAAQPSTLSLGLRVQRKCACGGTRHDGEDTCAECRRSALQQRPRADANAAALERARSSALTVAPSDDALEADADAVADRVLKEAAGVTSGGSAAGIRRSHASPSGPAAAAPAVPAIVDRVLSNPGDRLDAAVRQDMERRFDHDFSRVRVHTGADAERSAGEIDANAYTVGHHIVFGSNQFAPGAPSGRRLLAHELTHVVQQSAEPSRSPVIRPQKKKGKKSPPKTPQICGRNSRKVAGNWITKVNIDVGSNTLTIEWNDPKAAPAGSAGTHNISPGAGKCCVDCNDETTSQTSGSLCTPKGGTWTVDKTACALGGHPSARNPTYFQRGGIAIHSGNTSNPPQSHGCSRTSVAISELIHDNVDVGKTEIASSGTWSSDKCYLTEGADNLSNRKDVCDGNKLKPKKPAKKKSQTRGGTNVPSEKPAPIPVAEAGLDESPMAGALEAGVEGMAGIALDGPGPNNAPASEEPLGEVAGEPESIEMAGDSETADEASYA